MLHQDTKLLSTHTHTEKTFPQADAARAAPAEPSGATPTRLIHGLAHARRPSNPIHRVVAVARRRRRRRLQKHEPGIARPQNIPRPFPFRLSVLIPGTGPPSSNRKIKGKRTNPPSPPINQTHAAAAASERATYDQERRSDPSTDPPPPPGSFLFYVNQPCRVKEPLNCPVIRSGLSSSSPPHTVSPASLGAKLPLPIPGPSGGLSLGGAC